MNKGVSTRRYQRFSAVAASYAVLLVATMGVFAVAVNAYPESGAAQFFGDQGETLMGVNAMVVIALACYLISLRLPRGFFSDPEIKSVLSDERARESSARSYRNAFYVVLASQPIAAVTLMQANTTSAVFMMSLSTLVVAVITYIASFVAYEWI